jgi:UDP-N-acetylglucosamine 2-epimerase (non-hydrolysing)
MKKILIVAGTRPEIIKLAPVLLYAADRANSRARVELCLTGQHQTMAKEALSIFGIAEQYDLKIMQPNQSPNEIAKAVLERLPAILHKVQPDAVLVQGDTTSAAMSGICAFNMKIPVGHVEAGLRSFDLGAPFPEEMNRKIISCVAKYNFCPTISARANLLKESIPERSLSVTGNTIVDAIDTIVKTHGLDDIQRIHESVRTPYVLVTAHRRESFGIGIRNICEALRVCAQRFPDIQIVYPVHLNPNIQAPVQSLLKNIPNIVLLPPISYIGLLTLLKHCLFVLSDSGGIQEEAPSFRKHCLVMRAVTERRESIDLGLSELVGTDTETIVRAFSKRVSGGARYPDVPNPYGDGRASERILETILSKDA